MTRLRVLSSVLAGVAVVAFVSMTPQLVELYFDPAPEPDAVQVIESPYITAPGNRIRCPNHSKTGAEYNGWIMHQSDGSQELWTARCVYLTRKAMRGMM